MKTIYQISMPICCLYHIHKHTSIAGKGIYFSIHIYNKHVSMTLYNSKNIVI